MKDEDKPRAQLIQELADLRQRLVELEKVEVERKQAEIALQKSEEKYRSLFKYATDAIFLMQDYRFVDCNPATEVMFACTRDEIVGHYPDEFSPPYQPDGSKSQVKALEKMNAVLAGQRQVFEWVHRRGDGTLFDAEVSLNRVQLGQDWMILAIVRNIAGRKQAEAEIRRRNQELALLNRVIAASASANEPEAILETVCRELALAFEVSQAAAGLLNDQQTEIKIVAEYLAKDQSSILNETIPIGDYAILEAIFSKKAPLIIEDAQSNRRLGWLRKIIRRPKPISLFLLPLCVGEKIIGGLGLDITEPRPFSTEEVDLAWRVAEQVAGALARTSLDKAHRRLSTAIEQADESVIITDTHGTILYVNPSFERVTGYSRAEAIGQNTRILKSYKHEPAFYQDLWETISAGQVWHGRFINKKKGGTFYTEEATISPVHDESGAIVNYVGLLRDITNDLELEDQYRQAQKMEAIGRLTGGIAHDFNNILTVINGFAELLYVRLPSDSPYRDLAQPIFVSGQRAAELVGQLLAFSRKQIIKPEVLRLNEVISEIKKMLQRIIGEDIKLVTNLAPDLWLVNVDRTQIEQVILNLAINARDAMPNGGQLTIATTNVILDEVYTVCHPGARPGSHLLLSVSDTGVGISEEIQANIFEPFFTTKEQGKGTGLGLATIFGIVKQNNGDIQFESQEGVGTTFKIYLPRTEKAIPDPKQFDQAEIFPQGIENVLLVEDDKTVRQLAAVTLKNHGYTVFEASNGEEALRWLQTYPDEIHLLLTDVIMPKMGGKALADQVRVVRPNTKILFTSGYSGETIVQSGVSETDIGFLPKPFSSATLLGKVREILDESHYSNNDFV